MALCFVEFCQPEYDVNVIIVSYVFFFKINEKARKGWVLESLQPLLYSNHTCLFLTMVSGLIEIFGYTMHP